MASKELERLIEDFERENIIFDENIKNLERIQKNIVKIKDSDINIKNNINQKQKDTATVNTIFLCITLIATLKGFFEIEEKSLFIFMVCLLMGLGIYSIVFLPWVLISYFRHDFYEIEYSQNHGLTINKKGKKIVIEKSKIKRVYLMADLSAKLIRNELYEKLEKRDDVKIVGNGVGANTILGKPRMDMYLYIEYYENGKVKRLRYNVNNVIVSKLREFIRIFEID